MHVWGQVLPCGGKTGLYYNVLGIASFIKTNNPSRIPSSAFWMLVRDHQLHIIVRITHAGMLAVRVPVTFLRGIHDEKQSGHLMSPAQ